MALKVKKEDSQVEEQNVQSQVESTDSPFKEDDVKVAETVQEPAIPLSQVEKMMNEIRAEFKREISLSQSKSELDKNQAVSEELVDDWMDIPVAFFSFTNSYSLHGYYKLGKEYLPPNKKAIKFKNIIRKKSSGGARGTSVVCVSMVKINSKKQLEFMRNSPYFGITFHESMDAAMNIDANYAQILIDTSQYISRMDEYTIIEKCRAAGLPVTTDLAAMRQELTKHISAQKQNQINTQHEKVRQSIAAMKADDLGGGGLRNTIVKD